MKHCSKKIISQLVLVLLLIPLFCFSSFPSYAATRYWCKACGMEVPMDPDEDIHTHVNLNCANLGKSPEEDPDLFTTTKPGTEDSTDTGEAGDGSTIPDNQKSICQTKIYEGFIWPGVFGSQDESNSALSSDELLTKTFLYALAILEGTEGLPDGAFDGNLPFTHGVVKETWYQLFECLAIIILTIRFFYEFSLKKIWVSGDQVSIGKLFRPFISLTISIALILVSHHILAMILYASYFASHTLSKALTSDSSLSIILSDQARDAVAVELGYEVKGITHGLANASATFTAFLIFAIPLLTSAVSSVVVLFIVFSRVAELVIRGMVVPFSLTSNFQENPRALQFIAEFAGVAFQSVVIVGVLWATNVVGGFLITSIIGDGSETFKGTLTSVSQIGTYMAALKLAQIGLLLKSQTIAKSIFQ